MAKRARAVVSGVVLVVASAFVVASTWQLIDSVFLTKPTRLSNDPRDTVCSAQLRTLEVALERASVRGARETAADVATRVFEDALSPEWQSLGEAEKACATPAGAEAYTSLLRLRRGLEGHARRAVRDVGPLRLDFEARLPPVSPTNL